MTARMLSRRWLTESGQRLAPVSHQIDSDRDAAEVAEPPGNIDRRATLTIRGDPAACGFFIWPSTTGRARAVWSVSFRPWSKAPPIWVIRWKWWRSRAEAGAASQPGSGYR